jgi:hypothetical protein
MRPVRSLVAAAGSVVEQGERLLQMRGVVERPAVRFVVWQHVTQQAMLEIWTTRRA